MGKGRKEEKDELGGVGRWTRPKLKKDNKNKVQFRVARRFLFILEARNFARLEEVFNLCFGFIQIYFFLSLTAYKIKAHLETLGCN